MKRRDLLKTGLASIGASAIALSGCSKKEETASNNSLSDEIIPKQTEVYKFSAPLLFHTSSIDDMAGYNEKFKKSKVANLYNSIPWPQSEKFNEWFMLYRGGANPKIKTYEDFERYVKYAFDKGFDVTYLMNSPKAFNDKDIKPFEKDFYNLLDKLWKTGIRRIKFANTQVAQLINKHNPNFQLSVATIMEYSSVLQYEHLFHFFPNINHICIPKDQNQNFKLLKALRKRFPDVEIEIMIGEGCLKFCPSRFSCMASSYSDKYKIGCDLINQFPMNNGILNGNVLPWDMEYYSAIGINNFKFVPINQRSFDTETFHIKERMELIEYGVNSLECKKYIEKSYGKISFKELLAKLPDIHHFIKHGHECPYKCGVDCNYCYECAKKLEKNLLYS